MTNSKAPTLGFTPAPDLEPEGGSPEKYPDDENVMTLDDFIKSCQVGVFVDDDGVGEYSKGGEKSGISVYPSEVLLSPNRKWTHVVWFNR